MAAEQRYPAWWLEPGPEQCSGCECQLHLEAMVHCAACDQALCTICAVGTEVVGVYLCCQCDRGTEDSW